MDRYALSDSHLDPGNKFTDYSYLNGQLIIVGDLLNILPLGIKQWQAPEGSYTIQSIVSGLPENHCILLGNHEGRLSWLQELFEGYDVKIARKLDITIDSKRWHFEHGHKFTEWKFLSYFADDWVEWATTTPIVRSWWYKFCVKQGWIPSKYMHDWKGNPVSGYQKLVGGYWAMVLAYAYEHNCNMVVGHSHTKCYIDVKKHDIEVIDLGANCIQRIL